MCFLKKENEHIELFNYLVYGNQLTIATTDSFLMNNLDIEKVPTGSYEYRYKEIYVLENIRINQPF